MMLRTDNNQKKTNIHTMDMVADLSIKDAMFKPAESIAPAFAITQSQISTTDWRSTLIVLAELSRLISQIACSKATNRQIKQFAGYELEECLALIDVLMEFGTKPNAMDLRGEVTLFTLKNAAAGRVFDEFYLSAQMQLHEQLMTLSTTYLKHATARTPGIDSYTRRFAILAVFNFRQHLSMINQIVAARSGV